MNVSMRVVSWVGAETKKQRFAAAVAHSHLFSHEAAMMQAVKPCGYPYFTRSNIDVSRCGLKLRKRTGEQGCKLGLASASLCHRYREA
jgi:hypothetical protein